jgi:phage shock protein A
VLHLCARLLAARDAADGIRVDRAERRAHVGRLQAGETLQDQAQQALAAGHEDLARAALIRRAAVTSQVSDLQVTGLAG